MNINKKVLTKLKKCVTIRKNAYMYIGLIGNAHYLKIMINEQHIFSYVLFLCTKKEGVQLCQKQNFKISFLPLLW